MAKLTLDPDTLYVTSHDPAPVPAGSEDEARLTPLTIPIVFTGFLISDAYC
ncbi:MAG TPA: hypothetical protein VHG91_06285 [Longimicrobium sp.]|nr:hypothetical protein [Longimicrobium sp.]